MAADNVIETRQLLHAHPELGFEEQWTAQFIANTLRELGLEVHEHIARTGVIGVLRGREHDHAIGYRADMDALPIAEENDLVYCSHNGNMHACGHDAHLAIALGYQACEDGYKVSYTTMRSLIKTLRTEEIDRRARAKLKRICSSNLLIVDEVGYLPISSTEGNLFFQLVSDLQERTSIIITTNKGFEEWTEFLGDAALATAILDRLSFRCDKIQIDGKSYRLENRKSFLDTEDKNDGKKKTV